MFAFAAFALSGFALWASVSAFGMARIIEAEQRSAVIVEAARQDREDDQRRRNEAQVKINNSFGELFKELMKEK